MKTAVYIEDGVEQVVLTPETPFEETVIKKFCNAPLTVKLFAGSFYDCRGGWTRQSEVNAFQAAFRVEYGNTDKSLILRIDERPKHIVGEASSEQTG